MSSFFYLGESIKVLYQQLEYSERKVIADEAEMKRHARLAVLRKINTSEAGTIVGWESPLEAGLPLTPTTSPNRCFPG